MTRALLTAAGLALGLHLFGNGAPMRAQSPAAGPLSFFKNHFITGDYVEGGVGLLGQGVDGLATGTIEFAGVPADADILAAYLYWQVATTAGTPIDETAAAATFNGFPLRSSDGPVARTIGTTASCWGSGDATHAFRADVLRFLPIDDATGKQRVNGSHVVQIADAGAGSGPRALGASLIVIYRDPSKPLNALVIYDGAATVNGAAPTLTQSIRGFYQPSATPDARATVVAASGRIDRADKLQVGNTIVPNPFGSADGASWDSITTNVALGTTPGSVTEVNASIVTPAGSGADCINVAAMVFKTGVQDSDGDGLLDIWESSTTPLLDPHGRALPLLSAMRASPYRKDVFVEIGYMHTASDTEYGGVSKPAHTHMPSHEALKLVGDAFKNAPVSNPLGPDGISIHFDLGEAYPNGDADEYIIRGAGLARGGDAVDEQATVCTRGESDPPWTCQYSDYPGTVGWKTGFALLRDAVIGSTPPPAAGELDPCDGPGNEGPGEGCERRFDRTRKDIFRYAFFAHAVGLPVSELPCLDEDDEPADGDPATGLCQAPLRSNPAFHTPRTNTGVGDFPGGDVLVTLGAFADASGLPVGTPFMQASTLMHEIGHGFERRHGGGAREPNCKPTYLSVMNYLYQLRGLLDDGGRPHLDFSRAIEPAVDETALSDVALGALPYRIGFYAPIAGSYLEGFGTPAARHCDGTPIGVGEPLTVRVDARTAAGVIDWNANGVSDSFYEQDVNFNGRTRRLDSSAEILAGANDWASIALNQIGARRSPGGLFVADDAGRLMLGPMSLDAGRGDLGRGDLGRGDLGRGDLGRGDLGRGDLGRGDLGRGDLGRGDLGRGDLGTLALGRGDLGRGDLGGGDLFTGDPEFPGGELDFETATDLAKTPPNEFRACVVGETCADQSTPRHQVRLDWTAPNVGSVANFVVYRVAGPDLLPGVPWIPVGQAAAVPGQLAYSLLDDDSLVDGAPYTYFAVAVYADGVRSDPSNMVTITAFNDPPQYTFVGFAPPMAVAGTDEAPSTSGTFNHGRALPLQWKLLRDGVAIGSLDSLTRLEAVPGDGDASNAACVPNGEPALVPFDNGPTGNSTFRVSGNGTFTFNWDTSGANRSRCYRLRVLLDDGSPAKVTIVRFQ